VQEAVNNAIRHGQPESVNVELRSVEGGVSLEVKDDGRGFDISHDMPGHGIDNMKTRARLISATFEIAANADGRGTTVKLTLPLKAVTAREAAE
jgi:signal transduction histidine kinase